MAKPNLALIPAAQGTKLYSVLPSDGSGDFDYTRGSSATRINAQGLIESVANTSSRLNYPLLDGKVVGCPHHILEPQRTNLVQYSEEFNNSYWLKALTSVTANQVISPDGSQTADMLIKNADYGSLYKTGISATSGSNYTFSVFVKKGTTDFLSLRQASGSNDVRKQFDLNTGAVTNGLAGNQTGFVSSNFEEYSNGWYRLSITCTSNGTSITISIYSGKVGESTFNGNSYIWGAMLEQGSYPTSYIKSNSGSATTRLAETADNSGSAATFNDSEGVLMAEISALANSGNGQIRINEQGVLNSVIMEFRDSGTTLRTYIFDGNATNQFFSETNINPNDNIKIALKYKQNDCSLYLNGFVRATDTTATMPSNLNALSFNQGDGNNPFYGKTKQLQYFDSILDSQQLEELTSWDSFSDMANGQLYTIE